MPRSDVPAGERDQLRIVIVGHVDHGKSTLVGRLIHDTGSLPEGKIEAIKAMCERRGMPFEWAFLMDAFQAERDQGITIDTAQIWLRTPQRDYVIIDAPGHREFIKNMITGASTADAALVLIDAGQGIQQQSRFHGFLLHLLGILAAPPRVEDPVPRPLTWILPLALAAPALAQTSAEVVGDHVALALETERPALSPGANEVAVRLAEYVDRACTGGTRPLHVLRHAFGLFAGVPGAKAWKRVLTEGCKHGGGDGALVLRALEAVETPHRSAA